MQGGWRRGAFPWPLLLLRLQQQAAWAALMVSVPTSPIPALPFSDVWLPCTFSDSARPLSLQGLGVTWKRGEQTVAEYMGQFQPTRPGAEMSEELLRVGNASLLLPRLQDTDAGVYTCIVIFTPERKEGRFELKLEAVPHIALGSPKLQLGKQAALICKASGFYPGDISVEWLKDGAVVKGPQTSLHLDSQNGLYNANSIWEFTPEVADPNTTFTCRVTHKSLKDPLEENLQMQLQALPSLQVFTVVSGNSLEVLKCLVSGFYPRDVQVHWLRNRVPQQQMEALPQTLPNGTFSMWSILWPKEMDPAVSYVCQAQHKAWDTSLEVTAHWQPKEEGIGPPCNRLQPSQSSGAEGRPCSCSPTPIPASPSTEAVAVWSWLVLGIGLVLCVVGGIMLYMASKKRKNMLYPDTKNKSRWNAESAELVQKPENDRVAAGTTTLM